MTKVNQKFTNVAAVIVLFVVFVFSAFTSAAAVPPTTEEIREANLEKVFSIGKEVGNPETLQAILLQESGGVPPKVSMKPSRTKSYGLMQVQIASARSIFKRIPDILDTYFPNRNLRSVTDKEIVNLLVLNDEANIRIAAHHFNLYLQLCGGDLDKTIFAYNVGIGTAQGVRSYSKQRYVKAIKAKMDVVQPFNILHGLES